MEEESKPIPVSNSEEFFDAFDEFPFFDCISDEESVESSTISEHGQRTHEVNQLETEAVDSSKQEGIRRRSSFRRRISVDDSKDLKSESVEAMQGIATTPRERKNKILKALKDRNKKVNERSNSDSISTFDEQNQENSSIITSENRDSSANDDSSSSSGVLVFLAGLVVKAIGFQVSLLLRFFTFPIWFSYCSYLFVLDPFGIVSRMKKRVIKELMKVSSEVFGGVTQYLCDKLKGQKCIWNFVMKFGWGFFWSVYICFVLFGFLVSGFVIGGITMRYLVEEPVQMTVSLNFDYTKSSPAALVPIPSCPSESCGVGCKENIGEHTGTRFVPPNHKFQVTVSLTLPESDYNRNLGVFQVRVEFLSENGEVTASSRHPCMLRFKSHALRYLETFMKSVPLLAGYSSEAQVLKIKMRGFTQGYKPTSCLRVIIEQRAEYKSGAGIPEIYEASLVLESELPLFRRILWYWKRTVYIWISMVLFMMQLIIVLLCCRPILIPRVRRQDGSANNSNTQNTVALAISS